MPRTRNDGHHNDQERPPIAVWPCNQEKARSAHGQLCGRLITDLSNPGDTVALLGFYDGRAPRAAAQAERRTVGFEVDLARVRRAFASTSALPEHQRGLVELHAADARRAPEVVADLVGRAGLVAVWLPDPAPDRPGRELPDGHLGRLRGAVYAEAAGELIGAAAQLVAPGGAVAVVCSGRRQKSGGIDRVAVAAHHAHQAGLVYVQHILALVDRVRDGGLDHAFPALPASGAAGRGESGATVIAPAHDDVVLLAKPRTHEPDEGTETGAGVGR